MATTTHTAGFAWNNYVTVDRQAIYLAVLFLFVIGGALWLTLQLMSVGVSVNTPGPVDGSASGAEGAAVGGGWALAEALVAGLTLVVVLVYNRSPEWIQSIVRWALIATGLMAVGAHFGAFGAPALGRGILLVVVGIAFGKMVDHFDVFWIVYNLYGLLFAISIAAGLGIMLSPTVIGVALLGLAIYDHVFANRRGWMFTIGEALLRIRLIPVMVIKPEGWRVSWDDIVSPADSDAVGIGDAENRTAWGIGVADLSLPAAFAAAVIHEGAGLALDLPTIGAFAVVVGVAIACFRLRYRMLTTGSGAGLPALATGTLGAYALIAVGGWLMGVVG